MTHPAPGLDLGAPPRVEALSALPGAGRRATPTWTPARLLALALLAPLLTWGLADALPPAFAPSVAGWGLLAVAGLASAATLATYLPRSWPPRLHRPGAPCAAGGLVLLVVAWLTAGVSVSTAALAPVALLALGALGQRLLTAGACAPPR
ncbi:hypothetical protein H9L10_14290 [Phycicoccus endophyticus]|uniref:Uncharacterized protein n=1 Tax=Phycicoccus endophyticus TaxID=1690220 RepID=A0A7G9R176_9MICO|nr:hypothetical protein [Phycicoccus endophyticus]NHI20516.1 hypothetical protein [Phycicoccus endophyticus]QNN49351.1 hypothetical protein H9L10_14290 [Phycicoccus endophyticus]GGL45170.1 hypothetical protein GCM10012283_29710 [Phycicoccus endophyticus]